MKRLWLLAVAAAALAACSSKQYEQGGTDQGQQGQPGQQGVTPSSAPGAGVSPSQRQTTPSGEKKETAPSGGSE
jgi:hypothetical protein